MASALRWTRRAAASEALGRLVRNQAAASEARLLPATARAAAAAGGRSLSSGGGGFASSGGAVGDGWGHHWQRQQGAPVAHASSRAAWVQDSREQQQLDWGHLYSLQATEMQQHHYLQVDAAARAAAVAEAAAEAGMAGGKQRGTVALEATRAAADELAAEAVACDICGDCPTEPDWESDFRPDHQLVLRSSWLCAGAGTLADMRQQLQERIRFLADLEADGWQLEAPVDDQYACLQNLHPKPLEERRLVEAWGIAERWERSVD